MFFETLKGRRFGSGIRVFPRKLFEMSNPISAGLSIPWKNQREQSTALKSSVLCIPQYSVEQTSTGKKSIAMPGYLGWRFKTGVGLRNLTVFNVKKQSINRSALMNIDGNLTGRKKQEVEKIFQ